MLCNFCQQDMWRQRVRVAPGKWTASERIFEQAEKPKGVGKGNYARGKKARPARSERSAYLLPGAIVVTLFIV